MTKFIIILFATGKLLRKVIIIDRVTSKEKDITITIIMKTIRQSSVLFLCLSCDTEMFFKK